MTRPANRYKMGRFASALIETQLVEQVTRIQERLDSNPTI